MKRYSIIHDMKCCYRCGATYNLHKHEIFFGHGKRNLSIKHGLVVALCGFHHNQSNEGVHGKNGREYDLYLKKVGQEAFERENPDLKFIEIFGKNYI